MTGSAAPMGCVGRSRELSELTGHVDEAIAGRGRLVLVAGEPGMGKTRLVEELADRVRDRVSVVWATCWDSEAAPPLWLWTQAMRGLSEVGSIPDPELVTLLREGDRAAGLLGEVDPGGARFRLFDRVATCLCTFASRSPLLLVLDDLHWADRSSLQQLAQLSSMLRSARLVVVGTYRDTEVGDPLARLLAELPRDAVRLDLTGLARGDLAPLVAALAREKATDALVDVLHGHTGGNPFFVRELVRLLLAQGRIAEPGTLPAGVREVLDRRLARLSSRCYEALAAGAVIGKQFEPRVLDAIMRFDTDELSELLDEGVDGRVLVESPLGHFAFVHDLFRNVLYHGLGRARRLRLHLAVAEALESRYAGEVELHLSELAYHFVAAAAISDAGRAVAYARRAGEQAAGLLAFDEAVGHFERALTIVPSTSTAERAGLLLSLGDARWRAQDIAGARHSLAEAADLARGLDDAETFARAALAYACGLGGNQPLAEPDQRLLVLLEEAVDRIPVVDSVLRCRVLARLAAELYLTDDAAGRLAVSAEAVAMARRLGDPSALATALYARQIAVFGPDGLEERQEAAEEILALARHADDPELALWGQLFRVWARQERCLPIADDLDECARLAARLRLPGYRAEVALRQAVIAVVAGRFEDVDRLLALVRAGGATDPVAASSLFALQTLQALLQGPLDEIVPAVDAIVDAQPAKPMWRAARASLYAELGRVEDARRELDHLAARGFDVPRDGLWLNAMYFLGFVSFVVGDRPRADQLHGLIRPHVDQAPVGAFGSMATAVGLLDAACDRYDEALAWLELGHDRNLAMDNRAFAAWTRRERAAVLLQRDGPGDRDTARSILGDVVADLRASGFDGFLVRAQALLSEAESEPEGGSCQLRREGAWWVATYAGTSAHVAHSKGVSDVAVLLDRPGREVAAVDLAGAVAATDTGEVLDARARREIGARLADLEEEVTEAEELGDPVRAEKARAERDALAAHLASALGLGGRARRGGDPRERARKAVTWRIRRAIRAITAVHPQLGAHLDRSVHTGTFCSYQPDRPTSQ